MKARCESTNGKMVIGQSTHRVVRFIDSEYIRSRISREVDSLARRSAPTFPLFRTGGRNPRDARIRRNFGGAMTGNWPAFVTSPLIWCDSRCVTFTT